MDVVYDEHKLAELIVYLADRLAADRAGGSTKLNKVLFFPVEHRLLDRREHAVELPQHGQRQDDLPVLGLLVVTTQ